MYIKYIKSMHTRILGPYVLRMHVRFALIYVYEVLRRGEIKNVNEAHARA